MLRKYVTTFLLSLICILTLSCTLQNKMNGEISFTIPRADSTPTAKNNIEYEVTITGQNYNLSKTFTTDVIKIEDLQPGIYEILVTWKDGNDTYKGTGTAEIKAGTTTSVKIEAEKTPVETEGGGSTDPQPLVPESKTITDFTGLKEAISNANITEIIIDAQNIDFSATLTINHDVNIKAIKDVVLKRNNSFYEGFFVINANVTLGDGLHLISLDGDRKGAQSLITVNKNKTVTLELCCFENNISGSIDGGAINNSGNCTINNCTIRNNSTSGNGGGIMNIEGSLNVIKTTLGYINNNLCNSASKNGGAIAVTGGTVTIDKDTTIQNNKAVLQGGGIWADGGSVAWDSNTTIENNTAGSYNNISITSKGTYTNGSNASAQGPFTKS